MAAIHESYQDKRGVTTIIGWWDGNALWFPAIIGTCAMMCILICAGELNIWIHSRHIDQFKGFLFCIPMTAVCVVWTAKLLSLRRQLMPLKSWWEMRRRLSMSAQEFEALLTQDQIKPRHNVNGYDMFSEEDFVGKTTLLRGSSSVVAPAEELLRVPQDGGSGRDLLHVPSDSDKALL